MFLKAKEKPVIRRLPIRLPQSTWDRLDAFTEEAKASGVSIDLAGTLAHQIEVGLRQVTREAKKYKAGEK